MDRERLKRDVERIEKHRKEKAEVAKSEREIFAALKGDGFNCKSRPIVNETRSSVSAPK